jgi:predicted double-glycine peptidase
MNKQLNLLKDYVKSNTVLTKDHKTKLFTAIKQVKGSGTMLADADKEIIRKQIANSLILSELNNKKP